MVMVIVAGIVCSTKKHRLVGYTLWCYCAGFGYDVNFGPLASSSGTGGVLGFVVLIKIFQYLTNKHSFTF